MRRWFHFWVASDEVGFNTSTAGPGMNLAQLNTFRRWLDEAIAYLEQE